MKKFVAYLLLILVLAGGGCIGTLSEHMTPGRADPEAVAYVEEAGVGKAEEYKGFLFPSLAEVRKLRSDLDAAIVITDQDLKHLAEKKKLKDRILKGVVDADFEIAVAREDLMWNPTTGAISIGLSLLGIGASGYLGLMRKRPKDITPEEMEAALSEVKDEVTDKDRKLIMLVNSVQKVIDAQPNDAAKKEMVAILKNNQLPEIQQAVKEAKAKL